jgi:hypothetical protein
MTALNIATDIPSEINSVEKLMVWGGNILHRHYSDVNKVEGPNYSQRSAQAGDYYIDSTDMHVSVCRQSIDLDPDYKIGGKKMWAYAKDLGNKVLTAEMKAN